MRYPGQQYSGVYYFTEPRHKKTDLYHVNGSTGTTDNIRRSRARHADALSLLPLYQRHTTTSLRVWPAQKTLVRGRVHSRMRTYRYKHRPVRRQNRLTGTTSRHLVSCEYMWGGRVERKPLTDFSTFSTPHGISGCKQEKKQIENLKIPTHCLSRMYIPMVLGLDNEFYIISINFHQSKHCSVFPDHNSVGYLDGSDSAQRKQLSGCDGVGWEGRSERGGRREEGGGKGGGGTRRDQSIRQSKETD